MRRPLWMVCLCLVAILAIWLYVDSPSETFSVIDNTGRNIEEGENLIVTGRVYRVQTRTSFGREQLLIYLDSISIHANQSSKSEANRSISYHVICQVENHNPPLLGSFLKVKGEFTYFPQATNPGEFDASQYYRIMKVGGSLENANILANTSKYSKYRELLYQCQSYLKQKLYCIFPEKEASILCTMLLGDGTQLDRDTKELYKRNGIIHILSISGLHITLIGMSVFKLLRRCGCSAKVSAICGCLLLIFYGGMTGMGVSAFRAIGMYIIRMLGIWIGRTYDMLTSLGVLAVVMLFQQPEYLYHCGFLLSFGSVCGIGVLSPHLESGGTGMVNKVKQSLLTSLTVTIFTLPIHLWFFYELPTYSVFVNLLILPFVSVLMITGIIMLLLPEMKILMILKVIDQGILYFYQNLCIFFDKLPFHSWVPGKPEWWQVLIFYIVMIMLINTCFKCKKKWKLRYKLLVLTIPVMVVGIRFPTGLQIHFIDVGQGDSICVQTDGGETYLFDGGSSSKSQVGKYILIPYLKNKGISHIDSVFITHPDQDHCNGIIELIENGAENGITIDRIVLPSIDIPRRPTELEQILSSVENSKQKNSIQIAYIAKGATWLSGNTTFTCLHPEQNTAIPDPNSYSSCFLVQNGAFSMLLTGDIEKDAEKVMAQELAIHMKENSIQDITVLKVAHHGSNTSTSTDLLDVIQPQISVISCGRNNSYGHPHPQVLERLTSYDTRMIQTTDRGAVCIKVGKKKIKLEFTLGAR